MPLFTLKDIRKRAEAEYLSLVKCDIEGGEYDILLKSPDEELKKVVAFILEYHTDHDHRADTLSVRLRELGYGVQIFPSKFDKQMGFLLAINKHLRSHV